jgi:hypothetical protein
MHKGLSMFGAVIVDVVNSEKLRDCLSATSTAIAAISPINVILKFGVALSLLCRLLSVVLNALFLRHFGDILAEPFASIRSVPVSLLLSPLNMILVVASHASALIPLACPIRVPF